MQASKSLITTFLIYLLIIFSILPYIQVLPLGTDSQPNALLVSICLFPFCCSWKMNRNLALLLLLAIISLIVLFISPLTFGSIRSLINYFSLFFITYVTYLALKRNNGIPYKLFSILVYIWFFVGTIQLLVYPSFMSFLIPRGDSSSTLESGRGITCLAPEPTFYGIICLFLGMIAWLNFRNQPHIKRLYGIIAIQLFLYSRSSLAIFVLLASFCIYTFFSLIKDRDKRWKAIGVIIFIFLSIYIIVKSFSDEIATVRIGKLISILIEHPESFIVLDASANERFMHIFFPLYGFFHNWGLPHGYENFATFMDECFKMPQFQHLFTDYVRSAHITRIMSGWGSIFYELGIAALILLYVVYNLFSKLSLGNKKHLFYALFCLILLNAVPFSNAIIPFFIGNLFYLNDIDQYSDKTIIKYENEE